MAAGGRAKTPTWVRRKRAGNTKLSAVQRPLAEPLLRKIATAEILRVSSRCRAQVRPAFDATAMNARRGLGCHSANVTRIVGDRLRGDDRKAKATGATAYLAKPCGPFDLLKLASRIVPES